MNAPSEKYKRRIVEMFDSFCKTVSRNYSRNLKRARRNHDKHFTQEPVELLLELWDEYPSLPYTFHVDGSPCVIESETLYNALLCPINGSSDTGKARTACRKSSRRKRWWCS